MFSQKEDIDLIQELDQKRNRKCHYCEGISKYHQPEKSSGIIIDVCEKHFIFKHMA